MSLEGLLYPDNGHRTDRLNTLINDTSLFYNESSRYFEEIQQKVTKASTLIQGLYAKLSLPPPPMSSIQLTVQTGGVGEDTKFAMKGVASLITAIGVGKFVSAQLERAAISYLVATGRIGIAAFAQVVGLPTWMRVVCFTGAGGASIVLSLVLTAVIDSIDGAVCRSNLRNSINIQVPARASIYKANRLNAKLFEDLSNYVAVLKSMKQNGCTEEQLENAQNNFAQRVKKHAKQLDNDDQGTINNLKILDQDRASWTNEDPTVAVPIVVYQDTSNTNMQAVQNVGDDVVPIVVADNAAEKKDHAKIKKILLSLGYTADQLEKKEK
ncbi:predicted protein [Naegleria gruberi]|uniref:Predicted protein n=1 Tax=Naegleria gruberi TaxID=5762 RepID=D2VSS9_NAEGR|nr:uncharacterized protein NAEGRDRAFT_51975 [Naegleria gruberi]EFC40171.1 predicted protein [Naegleria gruberi]|eukprot:XP_002672915.1 predicted protein [Naegleria gruberi strain NEG-M]